MGSLLKIGRFFYRFVSVPGRQLVKADGESSYRECAAIRDDDAREIRISDGLPLETQLAEAGREVLAVLADQNSPVESEPGRMVDHLSIPSYGKVNAR